MLIEYDKSPRISPEQRIQSLADSVMRAFEELESGKNSTEPKPITLEDLGAYPKTGGTIDGDVSVLGNKVALFGEAEEEGFIVKGEKPSNLTGNVFVGIDEELLSICSQSLGADIIDHVFPGGEIPDIGSEGFMKLFIDLTYPPGRIIETDNPDDDPNVCYPWQTWERYGNGRVTVGVDESDADFASAGLELGEKKHTLTVAEMPSHSHSFTVRATSGTAAAWRLDYQNVQGQTAGTNNTGGSQPHNNIQPSITVYRWRRVE